MTEPAEPAFDASNFEQLDAYNWDADDEFRSGLTAILGSSPTSPEDAEPLILRARCFYYARKFNADVDYEAYSLWKKQKQAENFSKAPAATNGSTAAGEQTQDKAAGPRFSYQEIVDMIQTGKQIPGIKDIPDTILEGKGTSATKIARRKPWERNTETTAADASVSVSEASPC